MSRLPSRVCLVGLAAALPVLAPLGAASSVASVAPPCVRMPVVFPAGRLPADGATIRVPVGAIVYVALVEPDAYTGGEYPIGFPWERARSSDPAVIAAVRLCPRQTVSTLVDIVTAFRARRAGAAQLLAPLVPRWRPVRHGPRPYRARVVVVAAG